MPLNAEQLELPYFVPSAENVRQIMAELRPAQSETDKPVQDEDFFLFRDRTARFPWRWEGGCKHSDKRSQKSFSTEEKAMADAEKQLAP